MKITENVHKIRMDFQVTPQVKRYVNIYLLVGEACYLIDSGVAGSETVLEQYLTSIGRKLTDIKGIFLTHSHPDHIGGAAELKKRTGCMIYAPKDECEWMENIDIQFKQRPIPNFYELVSESVAIEEPLCDGDIIKLEEGMQIRALATPGHSHGSMSYVLNDTMIFTGDAIPIANDLPIFVDYKQSLYSLNKLENLREVKCFCPAWDDVCNKEQIQDVLDTGRNILVQLKEAVHKVEEEHENWDEKEKNITVLELAGISQYAGNPLVAKSIEACKKD